ncbi:RHS repeat-associated core domain-containing protein [Clostridium sp. YIM B02505]|uniref:RHS repeat-associated core domain-containing protein n=2 Tax=Clostridium yunnanense TaxID=2800325 RepID=A0ABS1EKU7_9CLOT|nr:RHS repeat-associated core domain-containing protein [Clostridium yunnanense]
MNGSAVSGDFASKISYKTSEYFYIRNAQGDIIGLVDENGTQVVSYTYDTWGKLISIDGSLKDSVGVKNPYRYRGYRYDTETGLYYLQSRYYNPDWGRFINADAEVGKVGTLISHNMFAYCLNNPVNMSDPLGHMPTWAKWAIGAAVVVAIIAVVVLAPEVVVVAAELASDVGAELAAGVVAVGTEIEEASPRIEEATSKLKEVASKAENYILKESQYNDHIIARHGATSTQYLSKSKFASNFDVKKGIDVALKSAKSLIRPNTNGRSGYIVEHTFDNIIGYNNKGRGVYTMKAVIDEVGKIVTVFPK